MDQLMKIKDSVWQFLSPPSKRRRTLPATPVTNKDQEHLYLTPISDIPDKKGRAASASRLERKAFLRSNANNTRKRTRASFEQDISFEYDDVSPDDSISQVAPNKLKGCASESVDARKVELVEQEDSGEDQELSDEELEADEEDVEDPVGDADQSDEASEQGSEDFTDEEDQDVLSDDGSEQVKIESETSDVEDEDDEAVDSAEKEEWFEEEEDFTVQAKLEPTPDQKVAEYLARQAELATRLEQIEKVRADGGWHPDELYLLQRILMLSFEELFPDEWLIDLTTLPKDLFTGDRSKQFFTFNCSPSGSGVKALKALLAVGPLVRSVYESKKANPNSYSTTERVLTRAVKAYIKSSERDGGFHELKFIPVLTVVSARPGQSIKSISTELTNQLTFLAERHRDHLRIPLTGGEDEVDNYRRQPPLLYGIIIAQMMVILVTFDSANPLAQVRHLQHFDFKDKPVDVWNSISIAMCVIVARNSVMAVKEEYDELDPVTDVDA